MTRREAGKSFMCLCRLLLSAARGTPVDVPDVLRPSQLPTLKYQVGLSQACSLQKISDATVAFTSGDVSYITERFSSDDQHPSLVDQHGRFWLNAQTHVTVVRFFDDQRHSWRQPQLLLKCRWDHDMALSV
jgi:hypothetical protein